jgi:hypothetical protein
MQHHRNVTIPQWKQQQKQIPSHQNVADAIRDIVQSYHIIHDMQSITHHYQWDTIRHMIHQKPMTDISISSSTIRNYYIQQQTQQHVYRSKNEDMKQRIEVIGFDWGSCAWRGYCGAIADFQESLDEIDMLLGVLEPNEILFCLDVMEGSIRDIMSIVTWNIAYAYDSHFLNHELPTYSSSLSN